jgi:hypothetical protein
MIKSLLVTTPEYLDIKVLPQTVKQQYLRHYTAILDKLADIDIEDDFNESDANNYKKSVKQQATQVINILNILNDPSTEENLLSKLVSICKQWDTVYKFDAKILYPELVNILDGYGY